MRKNSSQFIIFSLVLSMLLLSTTLFARISFPKKQVTSTVTLDNFVFFDGNQIGCWVSNDGQVVSYEKAVSTGLFWPKESGLGVVFQSGPFIIGKVNGEFRSASVEYTSEYYPGKVFYNPAPGPKTAGTPDNSTLPKYRLYKINRGDSSDPASPRFNPDYTEWPVDDGAPAHDGEYFTDLNNNQVWDKGEPFEDYDLDNQYDSPDGLLVQGQDPPLISGDQTLWYVMNDFDKDKHKHLFSTQPLGIEVQVSQFGSKTL